MQSTIIETSTWRPVTYGGVEYDLSHLDSVTYTYIVTKGSAALQRAYTVDVIYSPHCFTCGIPRSGDYDVSLEYMDGKTKRLFDRQRWEFSHQLPGIINSLLTRTCRFGSPQMQNYLTVEVVTASGQSAEYYVFFKVTKSSAGQGRLTLFVNSAYLDADPPKKRIVRFEVILARALEGKQLHE